MNDRRSRPRHATELIEVTSPTFHGQVLNLSMDGLAVETATALPPGKKLSMRIDGEGATVIGRVKWSRLSALRRGASGDSEPIYRAGIEIDRDDADRPESD